MKHIVKKPAEPEDFVSWRSSQQTTIDRKLVEGASGDTLWEILPSSLPRPETDVKIPVLYSKSKLRRTLLEEQGYICCYCNRALEDKHNTIIEHFNPKGLEIFRHQTFDYYNLFACCDGGERDKTKPRETYCTLFKGRKNPVDPIPIISPLNPACENLFEYGEQGAVNSVVKEANYTIDFLNLNAKSLKLQRSAAINTYIYEILSDDVDTTTELERLRTKVNGKFEPFCIAVYSVLKNYP